MIPSPGQLYRHRRDGRVAMVVAVNWWGATSPAILRTLATGREAHVSADALRREWERVRLVSVEVEAWVPRKRPTTPTVKE